ncbi:MAG TPA: tetratricopeptide repeat protein [Bryobacteraceae bacterium]|nr:tetratricopeptide repeat protein [Bryobacteraceae bacterium]
MRKRFLACVAGLMMAGLMVAQPKAKSQKELDAFLAIQQATTVDARIAAADKFVTSFADSQLKGMALTMAAQAAEQKNDAAKAITYAETALEADPKNYQAMLVVSGELAKGTRENDLDKEEKLAKSEKMSNDAVAAIEGATKPNATITDEQWATYKKDLVSQVHENLGLAALARKKYDVAVAEFKKSVDGAATPDPATWVRLASAYDLGGKPDDGIAVLDKVLAMPNLNPVIKQYATAEKARAEKAKNDKK